MPVIAGIHQRVLEAVTAKPDALNMSTWHEDEDINEQGAHCGTTHCRAGWVVALAGKEGRDLEAFHNTELAAGLIYDASSPLRVSPCRFFDSDDKAMEDIRRMADEERALLAPAQ